MELLSHKTHLHDKYEISSFISYILIEKDTLSHSVLVLCESFLPVILVLSLWWKLQLTQCIHISDEVILSRRYPTVSKCGGPPASYEQFLTLNHC